MSQFEKKPDRPERKAWQKGQLDPNAGEWEAAAARGRELLDSESEATDLLNSLDQAIEERFGEPFEEDKTEGSASVIRFPRRVFAIAASILMLLSVAWLLIRPGADSVLEAHFVHYDYAGLVNTMGEENTSPLITPDIEKAIRLYENRKYEEAAEAIESLSPAQRQTADLDLFLGLSHLGADQVDRALPILESEASNTTDEARLFYFALALKVDGQSERAEQLLQQIVDQNGLFAERAQALILH
ncbi:MAG: hypothetical protein AAFY36_13760 [Bacteroidota bacterium]